MLLPCHCLVWFLRSCLISSITGYLVGTRYLPPSWKYTWLNFNSAPGRPQGLPTTPEQSWVRSAVTMTCEMDIMRVSVVRQVKGGTVTRQREERRLIFQLTTYPRGLNVEFNCLFVFKIETKCAPFARPIFVKCINAIARACVNTK